jgi:hypothetical protein
MTTSRPSHNHLQISYLTLLLRLLLGVSFSLQYLQTLQPSFLRRPKSIHMDGISNLRLTLRPTAEDAASTNSFNDSGESIKFPCVFDPGKRRLSGLDLERFWDANPTCDNCNSLTNRLDKDLQYRPLSEFALTAKQGCKFCALLIRGIAACVPAAERQKAFNLQFRHPEFYILLNPNKTNTQVKMMLDYFIRKGKLLWAAIGDSKWR